MPIRHYLQKKQSHLNHRPLVVGTLIGSAPLSHQCKIARSVSIDIVEVRLDTFSRVQKPTRSLHFAAQFLLQIREKTRKPLLLTIRSPFESGKKRKIPRDLKDQNREIFFRALMPRVDLVDLEIRRGSFTRKLTRLAHIHGVSVIHSYHDFKGSGNWADLRRYSLLSKKWKGDIFKIALRAKKDSEVFNILRKGSQLPHPQKTLIAMGSHGAVSRTLGFCFGSVLTYGHLGKQAAPGQMPVKHLIKSIRSMTTSK